MKFTGKKLKSGTIIKGQIFPRKPVVLGSGIVIRTIKQLKKELDGYDYDEKELIVPNVMYGADTYDTIKHAKNHSYDGLYAQGCILHSQITKVLN